MSNPELKVGVAFNFSRAPASVTFLYEVSRNFIVDTPETKLVIVKVSPFCFSDGGGCYDWYEVFHSTEDGKPILEKGITRFRKDSILHSWVHLINLYPDCLPDVGL